MKFHNLLFVAGTAGLAYWGLKNKDKLLSDTNNTLASLKKARQSYQRFQHHLETVASFQEPIQQVAKELTYKVRVYQQSISPNIAAIQQGLNSLQSRLDKQQSSEENTIPR